MTDAGVIDDYVARLSHALQGPRQPKRDLLAEARDGLLDAALAWKRSGLERLEAELAVVRECGPVEEIAAGFQQELSAGTAASLTFPCGWPR
ncbi:hypothetical protein ETD86_21630 [Nonomuraea turkmeniaca]|uniref:Uncharacterized protein n=1 Tax=Nonomuraea turkmeniaca TaxID=103838 RepID=A0A5S4FG45_9ACTN|nr:permease prefix domain 1-containing protein [Nonomuraea turkmeniaca]TMR18550.1 hypothetical protein ETD86_21630 [Nonomuraea turkmeniaca]